ncbi:MAG: hypothetical protein IPK71_04570 [Myxococcales bacterium]|nr:hypothetical protein [Myxococcales bacterium]
MPKLTPTSPPRKTRSRHPSSTSVPVPIDVLLDEARAAADVLDAHSEPSPGDGDAPGHRGLASVDPELGPSLAAELRRLAGVIEVGSRRAVFRFSPGLVSRARREVVAALRVIHGARTPSPRFAREAAALRKAHRAARSAGTLLEALVALETFARRTQRLEGVEALGGIDSEAMSAVRVALAREVEARARLLEERRSTPGARATTLSRICEILRRVRVAAPIVFVNRPDLARRVTSTYQRQSRARRRARQKSEPPARPSFLAGYFPSHVKRAS